MDLNISRRASARVLAAMIGLLALLSIAGQICRYTIDAGRVRAWVAMFDLNREQNLATYYQGVIILLAAMCVGLISMSKLRRRDPQRYFWVGLSLLLLALSFDELCSFHEQLNDLAQRSGFRGSGVLSYMWVVPAMGMVALVGLLYLRFIFHLPPRMRRLVICSAVLYVGGAVGVEMIGAGINDRIGDNNFLFQLVNNFEEIFEMSGMALFLVTMLGYMQQELPQITLHIGSRPSDAPDATTASADHHSRAAA